MIALSELDRLRFGYVTAKVEVGPNDNIESILAECEAQRVQFLIARCSTIQLDKVQKMEQLGFILSDTLIYYRKEGISPRSMELPEGFCARAADPGDAAEVGSLAALAFQGYQSHYHADKRLDRARCGEVYSSWASNSCGGGKFCDHMALITSASGDEIAAFAALKGLDDAEFDGVLFAVHPAFQRKGLFGHLLDLSQKWGIENGFTQMLYSTQVTNIAAQRTLCRHGFEPLRSRYTLHKWLDR